jgi:hypothetical protein
VVFPYFAWRETGASFFVAIPEPLSHLARGGLPPRRPLTLFLTPLPMPDNPGA